ncbi:MAG: DNA polymerase III subunit beta [Candidatus Riflebacteria bacterium]|nr:DNA polymerase III subunit beta [Candidatus Riflebacteria bacterium]
MKITMSLPDLNEALAIVGRAVALKGVKPILANVLLLASENEVKIAGTDLEIMVTSKIPAKVEKSGQCTIPAKIFLENVGSLYSASGEKEVVLSQLDGTENQIEISAGRGKFNLQIQGIEDFPPLPVVENQDIPSFEIDSELLKKPLQQVAIAMGMEEANVTQKSICFAFQDESIKFTATDIHRLAISKVDKIQFPKEFQKNFLVPSRSIPEILKILDHGDKIRISLLNEQLLFISKKFNLLTRLYDGRYPDFNRVIPKNINSKIKLKSHDLLMALRVVSPIAKLNAGMFFLDTKTNETRIWSNSLHEGTTEMCISSELEGDPIEIAFNVKYVTDFLSVIDSENVLIELITPGFPGLFKPENTETDYKYVIMPMREKKNEED